VYSKSASWVGMCWEIATRAFKTARADLEEGGDCRKETSTSRISVSRSGWTNGKPSGDGVVSMIISCSDKRLTVGKDCKDLGSMDIDLIIVLGIVQQVCQLRDQAVVESVGLA
jgi:hypothetical protein